MLDEGMLLETRFGTYTLIGYMGNGEINKTAKLNYLRDVARNLSIQNMDILAMQYMWFMGNFYGTYEKDMNQPIQDIVRIPVSDIDENTKIVPASKERKEWVLKSKLLNAGLAEFKMVHVPDSIIDGLKFFRKFFLDMFDGAIIKEYYSDVKELKPYHIYYRVINNTFYMYIGNNAYVYLGYDDIKTKNTSALIDTLIRPYGIYQFSKNKQLKELNLDCSFLLTL